MTSIRLIVGASALLVLTAGAQNASAQTWRGWHVAGYAGQAWQKGDATERVVFDKNLDGAFNDTVTTAAGANAFAPGFCAGAAATSTPSGGCREDKDGVDFGFRVGYDWQRGGLVFGIAAEGSKPKIDDSVTAFSVTPALYTFTREVNALGALRARAGYGGGRILVYGTGGFAFAKVDHAFATSNTANTFVRTDDSLAKGYQFGGGFEFKFGEKWSIGAEYLLTSLDDTDKFTVRSQGPAAATNPFLLTNAAGTDLRRNEKFEFQSVRGGLTYRF